MIRVELELNGGRGDLRTLVRCHVAPAPLELARATILMMVMRDHASRIMALTGPALADWLGALEIELLELEPGTNNPLRRAGYHTIGQVTAASAPELLAVPRFGPQGLAAVECALARFGLALRAPVTASRPKLQPPAPELADGTEAGPAGLFDPAGPPQDGGRP